jgi:hypothetical protein
VAESSSDALAVCWADDDRWFIAPVIWPTPSLCSPLAAAISCTSSPVFWIDGTICDSRSRRLGQLDR